MLQDEVFENNEGPHGVVSVSPRDLSPEALRGVVESFVSREGTDYGEREFTLDQKVAHVIAQLERGEARILFDLNSETVDIVSRASATGY
jgi:uncharacterized protein YheU (UPF0270 family)